MAFATIGIGSEIESRSSLEIVVRRYHLPRNDTNWAA